MSFLSCEEMLAAARTQKISLAEAVLRSDLAESRLTEAASMTPLSAAGAAYPAATPPRWNRPTKRAGATAAITLPR